MLAFGFPGLCLHQCKLPAQQFFKDVEGGDQYIQRVTERAALLARQAFFCEARDISHRDVLLEIAEQAQLNLTPLQQALADGSAMAGLSDDLRSAGEQGVKGSPTWVLNEGRQVLYGNVGYRVMEANVTELLENPEDRASWC